MSTSIPVAHRFRTGHPLRGAPAAVATRHHKTPLLEDALGGVGGLLLTTASVDTDAFGTFLGDRPRPGSGHRVVAAKAWAGAMESGLDLGLASEGSFGPDPTLPLVTVQHELVCLVQRSTRLCVIGSSVSVAGWVVSRRVVPGVGPEAAARAVLADLDPTHGLVVRPAEMDDEAVGRNAARDRLGVSTGILGERRLVAAILLARAASPTGHVMVESDLRALACPPRRPTIRRAAHDLARRLARICEHCGSPGVGRSRVERGLPCRCCATPTTEALAIIDRCPSCQVETHRPAPGGLGVGDPARCPRCNP